MLLAPDVPTKLQLLHCTSYSIGLTIVLVTAASKLLELVFLNNIETCIESSHNQFCFKTKHATNMCILFFEKCHPVL